MSRNEHDIRQTEKKLAQDSLKNTDSLIFSNDSKETSEASSISTIGPLTIGIKGTTLSDQEKKLLGLRRSSGQNKFSEYLVGGVILMRANWEDKSEKRLETLTALIQEIKNINPAILLSVDHEGGAVWRFQDPKSELDDLIVSARKKHPLLFFPDYEGAAIGCFADHNVNLEELIAHLKSLDATINFKKTAIGKAEVWRFESSKTPKIHPVIRKLPRAQYFGDLYDRDPETALKEAYDAGFTMAHELKQKAYIDFSLAPVVDLHDEKSKIIGSWGRAFHANPEIVLKIAKAFIEGMNKAGMPASLKHFPGHGNCIEDSHTACPVDARSLSDLEASYYPFLKLIQDKDLNIGMVMMAHVTYPAVDKTHTAGYSKTWISKLREMGFEGVAVSDCLSMTGAGVNTKDNVISRMTMAATAGCDNLLIVQKEEDLQMIIEAEPEIPDNAKSCERRVALFKKQDLHSKRASAISHKAK